jgi:DNA-binding SARP family transcriptional activator
VRGVRVDLLGPLRLVVNGAVVEVRGFRRRTVLVRLALAEGRTVTADQLMDALWPEEAPDSGRQALHSHISRLRSQLGPAGDRLMTTPEGYRLDLGGDGLDVAEARALLGMAKAELEQNPGAAYAHLLDADRLWRGPALAEFAELSPFAAASFEAEQLHHEVTDTLIAAAVAAGQADAVLGLAAAAVGEDPLRERAVLLQMQALAATGEASAALQVARDYRHRLVEETGLDPSPALNAAERAVAAGVAEAPRAAGKPIRPATSLFGRDAEVAALHRLLASDQLVTVVGPGGVGKTRVALEVARRADRATVLLLAPVTDPAAVSFALAHAMGLTVSHGDVLGACAALLADGPIGSWSSTTASTCLTQLATWSWGCSGPAPGCRCWPPAGSLSAWPPSTCSASVRCPRPRWARPRTRHGRPPLRSSSTAPPAFDAARSGPAISASSPTSSGVSMGCL